MSSERSSELCRESDVDFVAIITSTLPKSDEWCARMRSSTRSAQQRVVLLMLTLATIVLTWTEDQYTHAAMLRRKEARTSEEEEQKNNRMRATAAQEERRHVIPFTDINHQRTSTIKDFAAFLPV